jgi:hypothetical protein
MAKGERSTEALNALSEPLVVTDTTEHMVFIANAVLHNHFVINNYYLDESGSTGDLARPGARFDFGQQQVFTLACLGIDDEKALGLEIERLKTCHRIQASELKSASVIRKPELVVDLLEYLERRRLPLLIEVVDKRFMIAANMVNTVILPYVGACDLSSESRFIRNIMAEYIHYYAMPALFEAYVKACDAYSITNMMAAFDALLDWLTRRSPHDEIAEGLYQSVVEARSEFQALSAEDEAAQRRFLPIPDIGKRAQSIWMLPNLTCFTNIYARINRLCGRRIGSLTLFHDEQSHFDEIVRNAKRTAEDLAKTSSVPLMPFADYNFVEEATLVFTNSTTSPGIQAADVLAGFIMRYSKDVLYGDCQPSEVAKDGFQGILKLSEPVEGRGVNFVLPTDDLSKLGVIAA